MDLLLSARHRPHSSVNVGAVIDPRLEINAIEPENVSLASDESAIIIPRVPLEENHWWNDQNHGVGE